MEAAGSRVVKDHCRRLLATWRARWDSPFLYSFPRSAISLDSWNAEHRNCGRTVLGAAFATEPGILGGQGTGGQLEAKKLAAAGIATRRRHHGDLGCARVVDNSLHGLAAEKFRRGGAVETNHQ